MHKKKKTCSKNISSPSQLCRTSSTFGNNCFEMDRSCPIKDLCQFTKMVNIRISRLLFKSSSKYLFPSFYHSSMIILGILTMPPMLSF